MEFYKKLKASKPASNESINSTLSEVERKIADMQPVIQDETIEKSKVQRTISDIKVLVDSLNAAGGSVTVEQQERIKEIGRKYKEISVKHSYVSHVGATTPKSPRSFRRRVAEGKEMVQMPQNKVVFQQQVEETLKVMRQKRLDRLSVFVAEQSKLSEERSNRNNDSSEIEDAIKSIQKTEVESKAAFKSISEENIVEHKVIKEEVENVRNSPKLGRSRSNGSDKVKNGKSSTMRLINKFNCTVPVDSSTEDLTEGVYKASNVRTKTELSKDMYFTSKCNENSASADNLHAIPDNLDGTNILLSPTGKQRKAVYMYDHECQFLESEKRSSLPQLSTFGKEISQESKKGETKQKIHTYENRDIIVQNQTAPTHVPKVQNDNENIRVRKKIEHGYENSEIQLSRKSQDSMIGDNKSARCSIENVPVLGDQKIENPSTGSSKKNLKIDVKKLGEKKLPRLDIPSDITSRKKLYRNLENPKSPLKSPVPFPRRTNQAERILRKLQRNWESLDEILENDSDVDCDEIEDLKKTWEDANNLLSEYKTKITKLDRKSRENENMEKLDVINVQLDEVKEEVNKFKGLKRDCTYMQLSSRLSNYYLDVSKINFSIKEGSNKKQNTLEKIDRSIKKLESRVLRNESLLMEILDVQVRSIGTNCLFITKV